MEQINNDNFHCFIPIELEKAIKDKKGEDIIPIRGVMSTSEQDQQEEFLDPTGFDLSSFVKSGYINWNHMLKDNPNSYIGHPTKALVRDKKGSEDVKEVYMEGVLYSNLDKVKDIVKLDEALRKHGDGRTLSYSIEGKALQRDPLNAKRILKAKITGVAITPTPVNTGTYMEIIKGWTNENVEKDYDIIKSANGGDTELIVDVTNPETGMRYTVDKKFNIKVEKAISTTSSAGATKREDLEGLLKVINDRTDSDKIKKSLVTLAAAKIQGRLSSDMLEKAQHVIDIIKGGEGSKGGKVIGHTNSGKPIYEGKNGQHEDYKNYSEQDHWDAADIHDKQIDKKYKSRYLYSKKDNENDSNKESHKYVATVKRRGEGHKLYKR